MGKLKTLLSLWEKKAEDSKNTSNSTPTPKKSFFSFKKSSNNTPVVVDQHSSSNSSGSAIVSSEKNVPQVSNNESKLSNVIINENIRNESISSVEQSPSAPPQVVETKPIIVTQQQVEETLPSAPAQVDETKDETSIVTQEGEETSSSIVESTQTSSIEETSQPLDESLSQQEEETIPDETPQEELFQQGLLLITPSEYKAIMAASVMSSSLKPMQNQLDTILQQHNCKTREELPQSVLPIFDTLKVTFDMYLEHVFKMNMILNSLTQIMTMSSSITDDVRILVRVLYRNWQLIEEDDMNITTLFSVFVQMSFGTQDKVDLLIEMLRNEKICNIVQKHGSADTKKSVMGSVYPAIAKRDFKLFFEKYTPVYLKSKLPSSISASYCAQVYKEAAKYPEYVELFIEEAIISLEDLCKLRNEPIERLFCNGLYNMVKENPEKFFNSEKFETYEATINRTREHLFDSNKTFIEELYDLRNTLQTKEDETSSSGEDFILLIEYNGKKKKTKESGNSTFALLVNSILEKFQIQEEHQSMNELFDKGVIVEYFEESINDWVELERMEDIPRSPKVAKIRIVKEEIQVNQISQIIERNTNIQLVNDKYQILKRIGKGGFGSVYAANSYSSTEAKPHLCALKYIEIDSIVNFNRSMREGIQMLQLDHANIARISDVFEVQSSDIGIMGVETKRYLCFAMPLYSHGDLYELVKNQSQIINAKLLGSIMKQLMDSLTYLHDEYSIVHRDIKPQNVLIESIDLENKTLKPILSDFGLAKTLLKTETQVAGTASYMSPEMSSRRGYNLSTDIWSMGVMFYQLLSFDFITDVKGKVQNGEFDFLTKQIERTWSGQDLEIITSLKKLTFDMLNLDPEARPTSKQAFEALTCY